MHLTPEQIDRQPFRMTRRGYDIVQVRDFLREVATEMRERRTVRDRLAETGDDQAAAEAQAKSIISNAEETAACIVADAEARARSTDAAGHGQEQSGEIVANAEAEAKALIEDAEVRARERSGVVIAEAQSRLDELLAQEKDVRRRIDRSGAGPVSAAAAIGAGNNDPRVDFRDRMEIAGPDTSLADFMKATLRHEVHPE